MVPSRISSEPVRNIKTVFIRLGMEPGSRGYLKRSAAFFRYLLTFSDSLQNWKSGPDCRYLEQAKRRIADKKRIGPTADRIMSRNFTLPEKIPPNDRKS